MKIKIYQTVVCLVFNVRLKQPPVLGAEHRLRVFENRVVRRMFVPKVEEVTGTYSRDNGIMKSFMICTAYQILLSR